MCVENWGIIETVGTGRDLSVQEKEIINRKMKLFYKKHKVICIFVIIKFTYYDSRVARNKKNSFKF